MISNKKRVLIGSLIGVIILFIVVIGATYAFFTFGVVNNSEDTTISIKTGSGNSIELVGGITNFHINIDASDMSLSKVGKEYYATDVVGKKYEETEEAGTKVLGTISAKGSLEGTQNCSATLDIVVDGSMKSFLQEGDLILTVKQGEISKIIDLSNIPSNKPVFEFGLNSGDVKTLDVNMKLTNRLEDQKDLAGKTLSVSISVSDFVCSDTNLRTPLVALTATTDAQYLKKAEDTDELLRFVGTHTDADEGKINNYICFGTTDKEKCTKNPDAYLYRIIGITNESVNSNLGLVPNQLKLIKSTPLNEMPVWSDDDLSYVYWEKSTIFDVLNTTFVNSLLTMKIDGTNTWDSLISSQKWYNATHERSSWNEKHEEKTLSGYNSLIGLMYASDYYDSNDGENLKDSWLNLRYAKSGYDQHILEIKEWTMTNRGEDGRYYAWTVNSDGLLYPRMTDTEEILIRPVFYLIPYIGLSGSGSLENPFIITKIQPKIRDVKVINDNGTSIEVEVDANSNASIKEYCYKISNEKDYTCTNSKNHTFENLSSDNLYYELEMYVKDTIDYKSEVYKKMIRLKSAPAAEVLSKTTTSSYFRKTFNDDELTRYVGTFRDAFYNNNINNYICFGTNDMNKCLNDKESYMYRIIGITNDNVNTNSELVPNQLKIIKALPLKTYFNSFISIQWSPQSDSAYCGSNGEKCEWDYEGATSTEGPILRWYLNNTFLDTIKNNNEKLGELKWEDIISNPKWYKGAHTDGAYNSYKENEPLTNSNFKIGLMYFSDYYNAIADHSSYSESWLRHCYGIGQEIPRRYEDEWTMTFDRYGGYNYALIVSWGSVSRNSLDTKGKVIRPVMYLTPNVKLSGKGTADSPFIISVE